MLILSIILNGKFPCATNKRDSKVCARRDFVYSEDKVILQKMGYMYRFRKLINQLIKQSFQKGRTIAQLSNEHFLSIDSIKKIVYSR